MPFASNRRPGGHKPEGVRKRTQAAAAGDRSGTTGKSGSARPVRAKRPAQPVRSAGRRLWCRRPTATLVFEYDSPVLTLVTSMTATPTPDTDDYAVGKNPALDPPEPFSSLVQTDLAGLSHVGKVRVNNEDHFLICRFGRFLEAVASNLPADAVPARAEEGGFGMAVADGMGGTAAGEQASRLALAGLVNLVLHTPDWILRLDDGHTPDEVNRRAAERVEQVNETMADAAAEDRTLKGFGTTLTMAASLGRELFVTHIGDSRAYLLRRGRLSRLTRDHTMAEALADARHISRQEVATHRLRHVLTKFVGDHRHKVLPDVSRAELADGDRLLLCSDGLHDLVSEEAIGEALAADAPAQLICQRLVDTALANGGKDNVTVVVAKYRLP